MKTKKAKKAPIGNKLISELKLMVSIGATPIECVNSFAGKISRSTVYKLYNNIKAETDSKPIEAFEQVKAVNVPSEVTEEPISENKQFEEESAHIINELSGKNEELPEELHTQKVVIETLQKGVNELNEAITESKIMIAEIAKERDDKDEEIRVLNLELHKYKNDIKMVIEDRQKLECLLSDIANEVEKESAVEHPKHYNNIAGIECLDVVEHFNFNRGNAIKYVWRAGEKSKEKEVEDLKKAIFYIEREVKNLQEVK